MVKKDFIINIDPIDNNADTEEEPQPPPKPKKPRSEAQKTALEKGRQKRMENLKKRREELTKMKEIKSKERITNLIKK